MAFLDNSGDIILDAVLTDLGRQELAKGDGSFRIEKFALGDDEIDYDNYNSGHASGSAYYDLTILQTPVLEAFTNNTSTMKHKLVSYANQNLLYMPILKLNTIATQPNTSADFGAENAFLVTATDSTNSGITALAAIPDGIIKGMGAATATSFNTTVIRIDQGIDNTATIGNGGLDASLTETQYLIEIDDRIGRITDINGNSAPQIFVDDDQIATYLVGTGTGGGFNYVYNNSNDFPIGSDDTAGSAGQQILKGARGTILEFSIRVKNNLQSSDFYFNKFGVSGQSISGLTGTYKKINTSVKVTGLNTASSLSVPVKFIKKE
jgi:hypothetical protein